MASKVARDVVRFLSFVPETWTVGIVMAARFISGFAAPPAVNKKSAPTRGSGAMFKPESTVLPPARESPVADPRVAEGISHGGVREDDQGVRTSPSLESGILPRPLGRKLPRQCIPRSGEVHAVKERFVPAWRSVLVGLRVRRIPNQGMER